MGLDVVNGVDVPIVTMKDMQDGDFGVALGSNDIVYCHKPRKELCDEERHHYIVNLTQARAGRSWTGGSTNKVMLLPKGTTFKLN